MFEHYSKKRMCTTTKSDNHFRQFSRRHIINPAIAPTNINGWEQVMSARNMWGKRINTFIISDENAVKNSITEPAENYQPDDHRYSCKKFRIVCLIFDGRGYFIKFTGYRFLLVAVDFYGIPMHLKDLCKYYNLN